MTMHYMPGSFGEPHPIPDPALVDIKQVQSILRLDYEIRTNWDWIDGVPVLSIWTGIVLWSINGTFFWETGRRSRRQRPVYASHPTTNPDGAARAIRR